jgi:hypothetical protein
MRCPNCNSKVPEGKRFCGYCGYRLEPAPDQFDDDAPTRLVTPAETAPPPALLAAEPEPAHPTAPEGVFCPACGTPNTLGARFCNACAASLTPEEERVEPVTTAGLPADTERGRMSAPLMLMTMGGAIGWGVGSVIGWFWQDAALMQILDGAISEAGLWTQYALSDMLLGAIGGGMSGLSTGLALRRRGHGLSGAHTAVLTASWAIIWATLLALHEVLTYLLRFHWRIESWEAESTLWLALRTLGGYAGGVVVGVVLRRVGADLKWKWILAMSAAWSLITVVLGQLWPSGLTDALILGMVFGAANGAGGYGLIRCALGRSQSKG